jgi:hypothetical protein
MPAKTRVLILMGVVAALPALRGRPGVAACREDGLVPASRGSDEGFRAVTVLRQRELEQRGTPAGFECARMILGAYLHQGELDLADEWVLRLGASYASLMPPRQSLRLRVEVAYLTGISLEVQRRVGESGLSGLEPLVLLSRAAELPFSFDAAQLSACGGAACAELGAILQQRARLPRSSPGLALVLGLVPGLGQAYAGRPLAGLGSFLLDGFLAGAAAFAFHQHEYALSLVSGGIGLGFYGGSIYAGYEAATRFNERATEQLRADIRALPVDLELNKLAL